MKRFLIKLQLVTIGHCYCASPHTEEMDNLDDLVGDSVAVPWKAWALRTAVRKEKQTGQPWHVTRWGRE